MKPEYRKAILESTLAELAELAADLEQCRPSVVHNVPILLKGERMSDPIIRAAQETDLPALVAIYNHYVDHTHITFDLEPVTVEERRPWFDAFATTGRHRLLVAETGGVAAGYACSHQFRHKPAYNPSVETTVYVGHKSVGKGLGRALYAALFVELESEDVHQAFAGVALPNPGSMALHERFGFQEVGTFREVGRKFGKYWDVCWLQRTVHESAG